MNNIGDFFNKFKNLALVELRKRDVIKSSIEKVTGHKIEAKDISIKDGIVTIRADSSLKSEIYLKKAKILELIRKDLPSLYIKEIK